LQREPSVKALASKALSKIWSKMKAGRGIDELDLHNLHKLRLRAKRIRYMTEFTRGLYDAHPRRIESVLKVLGKMQSALGMLNDIASGTAILGQGPAERLTGHKNGELRVTSGLAAELVRCLERRKSGEEGSQSI
jgi:triphosphatase